MTKHRIIILVGAALMVTLYLYDRGNRTDVLIVAQVISLDDQDNERGPDSWRLRVQINEEDITLEVLEKRPVVAVGDHICVTRTIRAGQPDEYRYSPSANC